MFDDVMPTLLALLDRYDPLLFGLIYEEIEAVVERDCKGDFKNPKLSGLLDWLGTHVLGWVCGIYAKDAYGGLEEAKKMLKPTFSRFEYHVHKTLGLLRCALFPTLCLAW
jgi:anaphase-promoting complex subunit 2